MLEILSESDTFALSPNILAFYGDCVWELLVRNRIVTRHRTNAGKLHELAVAMVRASFQCEAVSVIEPLLTERENDILRRGRNAGGISVPKSAKPSEYRRATALEALFGYLKLSGQGTRAEELFEIICEALPADE